MAIIYSIITMHLSSSNRWISQRNNANNAWNFNGNTGNLNNNNVSNGNLVQGVANLSIRMVMSEEEFFVEQVKLVFNVQKNKRRGHDSLVYENHFVSYTLKGMRKRLQRSLRIENNYAFLVSLPKWREIMATEFEGRKIDHEICDVLMPVAEQILSPYTYNNRKGKGSQAAINQLIEHVANVSKGYTEAARIIKIDFKGYFPNALWDYAEKVINEVIDLLTASGNYKSYLKWLTMIAIHCNPAEHCKLRTPKFMWAEHIPLDKSIFCKPRGTGAAIGRLIWQMSMGLYINDIIIWLTEACGIKLVCFVDDIVLVVPEERHRYVLDLIPVLRRKLAERNIQLNKKKYYDQPYQHGLEFLGSHIKPYRIHLNNSSFNRAKLKIESLNRQKYKDIDQMVQSFNSYSGLLKNRIDYKRLIKLKDALAPQWWKWLYFNEEKLCLGYKQKYSTNERINRKYNLNLKKYRNYDKTGKTRAT